MSVGRVKTDELSASELALALGFLVPDLTAEPELSEIERALLCAERVVGCTDEAPLDPASQ